MLERYKAKWLDIKIGRLIITKVQAISRKSSSSEVFNGCWYSEYTRWSWWINDTLGQSQDIAGLAMQAYNKAVAGGFKRNI